MMIDSEILKSRIGELCMNNDDLFSAKAYERIIGVIEAVPTEPKWESWALLNELLEIGYPHSFQHEAPHISGYLYDISALIDKVYEIKAKEQASLLDRLAAEYDRKHPNGLKFVYSLDGEVQQTEQEEK